MGEGTPFDVLGVPFDVDDATLKRAYFRKVREHPPETQPAEFQKVHEAFEVLRDPERRRAIAEELQKGALPAELEALLAEVDDALRKKDHPAAVSALRKTLERFPAFERARILLARELAAMQRSGEALEHVKVLCEQHPHAVEPLLLMAEIQIDAFEYAPARATLRTAMRLAPEDRRPVMLEARMLSQMERYDEALEVLGIALKRPDRRFISDAEIIGHRVLMQTERGHHSAMQEEVERIVAAAGTDTENRKSAAGLLVQLAGVVLGRGRPLLARDILGRIPALAPERRPIDAGPPREVPVERLPDITRSAVLKMRGAPTESVILRQRRGPWLAASLLVASLCMGVFVAVLYVDSGSETVGTLTGALSLFCLALGIYELSKVRNFGKGKGADYLELRPFHLVEIIGGTARIFPLLSITGMRPVPNGVELHFEQGIPPVELGGGEELYVMMQRAAGQRQRLLSLLTSDLIETEQHLETLEWSATSAA